MESLVGPTPRVAANESAGIVVMPRVLERADPYMPILALLGAGSGIASYMLGEPIVNLVAGLLLLAMVPYTVMTIIAINRRILTHDPRAGVASEAMLLMHSWKRRHAVRSVGGLLALALLAFR